MLFNSKKPSGVDKFMLCGPPSSGKTSLLFELALSFGDEEKYVLYICPKKLSKLPLLAHGRNQPASTTLNYIQMVYLETREEYLNYMASIHFSTSRLFTAVIVDDINAYFPATIKNEDLSLVAKVFALTVDAFLFQSSKQNNQLTEDLSGMLVLSLTLPCGTNSVSRQTFYERWVQCFLLIQQKEVGLYELSVLPSNSRDNSSMSNVIYRVTDQTFVVQEIQYSSQSDSGSPIQ